jgi:hypothetical protein
MAENVQFRRESSRWEDAIVERSRGEENGLEKVEFASSSHHHQSRRPPLHPIRSLPRPSGTQETSLLRPSERISLTEDPSVHLKIRTRETAVAIRARQTLRMELLLPCRLQILAFDTLIARLAHTAIEFVVVSLAVWGIVDHVEGCGSEGLGTGLANETLFVITPSQTPVCR